MADRKVTVSDSVWTADHVFILRQLRADLATAANLGRTVRYRILTEDDVQLNAALELFPQATKLMTLSMGETLKGAKPVKRTAGVRR